ncbi:MAG: hypothetical protein WBN65_09365 [Gammaproteobacteria bacterium]
MTVVVGVEQYRRGAILECREKRMDIFQLHLLDSARGQLTLEVPDVMELPLESVNVLIVSPDSRLEFLD